MIGTARMGLSWGARGQCVALRDIIGCSHSNTERPYKRSIRLSHRKLENKSSTEIWHQRMGHANFQAIRRLPDVATGVKVFSRRRCALKVWDQDIRLGNEFKKSLTDNGIGFQDSTAYAKEQNGPAERSGRMLIEVARTLHVNSKTPKNL